MKIILITLMSILMPSIIVSVSPAAEIRPLIGKNTEILFTSPYSTSSQHAKIIIRRLQKEGYDIKIISTYIFPAYARHYNINDIPTLIIRDNGQEIDRKVGLLTDGEYRTLISRKIQFSDIKIRDNFTGTIRFVDNDREINTFNYKQLNPKKYIELAKKYNIIKTPTTLVLIRGKVIVRIE